MSLSKNGVELQTEYTRKSSFRPIFNAVLGDSSTRRGDKIKLEMGGLEPRENLCLYRAQLDVFLIRWSRLFQLTLPTNNLIMLLNKSKIVNVAFKNDV